MNDTAIIWDLETVPDLRGFAAANYLIGKTDAEIREVMGDKFPKHIYHSIACIGALVAHREVITGRLMHWRTTRRRENRKRINSGVRG